MPGDINTWIGFSIHRLWKYLHHGSQPCKEYQKWEVRPMHTIRNRTPSGYISVKYLCQFFSDRMFVLKCLCRNVCVPGRSVLYSYHQTIQHNIWVQHMLAFMMYLFTIVPHPHGHWQLQELRGNHHGCHTNTIPFLMVHLTVGSDSSWILGLAPFS